MRTWWLVGLLLAIWTFGASAALADDSLVVAPNTQSFNFHGGEAQSTVVPPGRNSQCPKGRILISDDWTPPANDGSSVPGVVHWRDLAGGAEGVSTHDAIPNGGDYLFLTADHDIVALPNGDIIYETGAGSKRPLTPKPAWFDVTYRGNFGPGTRTTVVVWRSTDCGKNFKFVSEIDSAAAGHEDCAYPQGVGIVSLEQSLIYYDMGGTDGQWLNVDRQSGKLILVQRCVGRIPTAGVGL